MENVLDNSLINLEIWLKLILKNCCYDQTYFSLLCYSNFLKAHALYVTRTRFPLYREISKTPTSNMYPQGSFCL